MQNTIFLFSDAFYRCEDGAMTIIDHVLTDLVHNGCEDVTPSPMNATQQATFDVVKAEYDSDPEHWTEVWTRMENEAFLA